MYNTILANSQDPIMEVGVNNDLTIGILIGIIILLACALFFVLYVLFKSRRTLSKTKKESLEDNPDISANDEQDCIEDDTFTPSITQTEAEPQTKSGMPWLSALIVLIIIALAIFGMVKFVECQQNPNNSDGNLSLKSRSANDSDIRIDTSDDLSLTVQYIVTPKVDIENLEVTFSFMDSEGNILTRKVKQIGNVQEDYDYTVSISLTEFSLSEIFTIRLVDYNVTGGTVLYIQS